MADTRTAAPPPMTLPWVESPFFARELALREGSLTDEQVRLAEEYHRSGYVALEQIIPHELCDRVRAELEPIFDNDETASQQRRVQDAWARGADASRELAVHPDVLSLLEMLYERPAIPFQTLGFKWGTEQRSHSDSIHFSTIPARYMCGVWVALEDTGPDNGPLFYYPGSHSRPEITAYDLGRTVESPGYDAYENFQTELMAELGIEAVEFHARKGDALVWSSNIVHGGRPVNTPGSTRWSQVTHFYFAGGIYYTPVYSDVATGELLLKDVVNLRTLESVSQTYNGAPLEVHRLASGRSRLSMADGDTGPEETAGADASDLRHQIALANQEIDDLRAHLAAANREITDLRSSASFRVGHSVLNPVRKARDLGENLRR